MKKYDLLDRAKKDLYSCKLHLQHYTGDELELDIVAYHLQQAVEKTMKFQLDIQQQQQQRQQQELN